MTSTAAPGTRGRSGCCSPPRTRAPRRTPPPRLPLHRHRHLRRTRPGWLRGRPERLRRQHLARRGHRRREEEGRVRAPRPRPRSPTASSTGTCRPLRVTSTERPAAGAAGAQRQRPADHPGEPDRAEQPRPAGSAHLRCHLRHPLGHHPRHRHRRHRAVQRQRARAGRRAVRRSSGPRTGSSAPDRTSASSSSTRPATPTRPAPRTTPPAAGARCSSCASRARRADTGTPVAVLQGRPVHRGLRQRDLPVARTWSRSSRTPATPCTPRRTPSTPAGSST